MPVISRRRLAVGTTWVVPAVLVSNAAPAFAASGCPDATVRETYVNLSNDRITVTNTSPTLAFPVGTTITWRFYNAAAQDTISITARSAALNAQSASSVLVANGATGTISFTTNAAVPAGSTVSWVYSSIRWNLRGTVTISFAGTTLSACPDIVGCVSILGATPGTTCPPATTLAAARTAGGSTSSGPSTPDQSWGVWTPRT